MTAPLKMSIGLGTMLLLLTASAARADDVARVNIPFPFVVNGRTLPAGPYDVRTDDQDTAIVIVEGRKDARNRAMVVTVTGNEPERAGEPPALTFVHRDGQYQLSVIQETGSNSREVLIR
jgi:hypothetical protein